MRGFWSRNLGLIVPALMAMSILVIVVPLPAALLDLLLSANIAISVMVLLTSLYVRKPLDFSVFPSLLLGTTLARLVLNVASTRLILTRGGFDGTGAAGDVIRVFGDFVAGGQVAVGFIIFIILIAIQFLVITKGATRISEVAARFALDGMPGRQMAIDADLQAGLLTAEAARQRRSEVAAQADFYAAMDGAGKFVRGDALAGIVITLINIIGGLYMGLVESGMSFAEAVLVFTRLTIGDGLVTQVPAFLVSLASGLLVTRTSAESDLPGDVIGQLFVRPEALAISAAFLGMLSFTGLPRLPLLCLAGGLAAAAILVSRGPGQTPAEPAAAIPEAVPRKPAPQPEDNLFVDPMELELGYGLIRLADAACGGDLLERVTRIRHRIAQDMGIILPRVRIRDNIRLGQRQYQIRIHDVAVAWGEAFPEGFLAIESSATSGRVPGIAATEPGSGRPAVWIEPSQRERAEALGYSVVEPAAVIATHVTEIVRRHGDELLSRQQVHQLLDNLRQHSPKVVEELIPDVLRPAHVHQVLCNLLRERVPIRNLEIVLQTLGDYADRTRDLDLLTEYVRQALARTICQQYRDRDRVLRAVTLDPLIESEIAGAVEPGERGLAIRLPPYETEAIVQGIARSIDILTATGWPPVLLTTAEARRAVRQITAAALPSLAVLGFNEITRDTRVELAGNVGTDILPREPSRSLSRAGP
jgi:flagellar biosynthesis protein FlhA